MGNRICGPLFPPASESGCPDPSNTLADGSCGMFPLLPATGSVVEPFIVTATIAVAVGLLIRRLVLGSDDGDD